LAAQDLIAAEEAIFGGKPTEGFLDSQTLMRTDMNAVAVFDSLQPDFLIAAQGSPNNLEGAAVREAVRRNIKTVVVSDIHGSGLRANVPVEKRTDLSMVLFTAMDSEDARVLRHGTGCKERPSRFDPKIAETGSPALDRFNANVEPARLVVRMASPFPHVFHIIGQDDCTGDFLDGALRVADAFSESVAVVSLHPKYLAVPELCNAWLRRVRGSKSMILWANGAATTHQYMASSTYVVSGYSTGLIEAGLIQNELGPIAVCWTSELIRKRMAEALGGLTVFPTVTYGAAIEVSSVEEFREKVPAPGTKAFRDFRAHAEDALRTRLHVDGHATDRIVAAIREHAGI